MSRKEAVNSFSEGLIKDLNPMNTPNTVLTDCVNGTIITYNGNEYLLQNDMGNYPLSNCKLNPNFVPVGLKEYNNILYIVSYNPLTDETEIGSYPSPLQISHSGKSDPDSYEMNSIIESITDIPEGEEIPEGDYTALVTNSKLKVLIPEGGREEDYKLNSGDKYKITNNLIKHWHLEAIEYYAIDDSRQTFPITDKITEGSNEPIFINWDVPGWIGIKYRLANFTEFNVNIRSFELPSYSTGETVDGKLTLNFQLITDDKLIKDYVDDEHRPQIRYTIEVDSEETTPISDVISLDKSIEQGSGLTYYFADTEEVQLTVPLNATVVIKATPIMEDVKETTESEDSESKIIVYNNFTTEVKFGIGEIGDPNLITLGDNIFKYSVEERTEEEITTPCMVLNFDVDGPKVLGTNLNLYYSVFCYDDNPAYDGNGNAIVNKRLEGFSGTGQNIVSIDMIPWNKENFINGTTAQKHAFYPEGLYKIEFKFAENPEEGEEINPLKTITKYVVISKSFNDLTSYAKYTDIPFDVWFQKALDLVSIEETLVSHESDTFVEDLNEDNVLNKEYWLNLDDSTYSNYAYHYYRPYDKMSTKDSLVRGFRYNTSIDILNKTNRLEGPMWYDFWNNNPKSLYFGDKEYTGDADTENIEDLDCNFKVFKNRVYSFESLNSNAINVINYLYEMLRYNLVDGTYTSKTPGDPLVYHVAGNIVDLVSATYWTEQKVGDCSNNDIYVRFYFDTDKQRRSDFEGEWADQEIGTESTCSVVKGGDTLSYRLSDWMRNLFTDNLASSDAGKLHLVPIIVELYVESAGDVTTNPSCKIVTTTSPEQVVADETYFLPFIAVPLEGPSSSIGSVAFIALYDMNGGRNKFSSRITAQNYLSNYINEFYSNFKIVTKVINKSPLSYFVIPKLDSENIVNNFKVDIRKQYKINIDNCISFEQRWINDSRFGNNVIPVSTVWSDIILNTYISDSVKDTEHSLNNIFAKVDAIISNIKQDNAANLELQSAEDDVVLKYSNVRERTEGVYTIDSNKEGMNNILSLTVDNRPLYFINQWFNPSLDLNVIFQIKSEYPDLITYKFKKGAWAIVNETPFRVIDKLISTDPTN